VNQPGADEPASARYLAAAATALARVTAQADRIQDIARAVAGALSSGHRVVTFGTGHSHLVAEDMYARAGGLAAVEAVLEPSLMLHEGPAKSSALERLPGYGAVLVGQAALGTGDVAIVISNSGRNAVPVEFAESARSRGCTVVAITSLEHSRSVRSRAPGGHLLMDVADLVIDNGAPPGDAVVSLPGQPTHTGAVSTVTGSAIVQAVTAEVAQLLLSEGRDPDLLTSNNVDAGADGS
jgi:uncharacterized phosphosugar-binding protein